MIIALRENGAVVIVAPQGRFDTNGSPEVERVLTDHIARGAKRIVLDLSRIEYISSIGLRVILKTMMAMNRTGGKILLCGGNDHSRTVLQMSGVMGMNIYAANVEEAIVRVYGSS